MEGALNVAAERPAAASEGVVTRQADGVLTVSLNRPERMNAVSADLSRQLVSQLGAAARDPDVRAVVLTGAGRAFCAGIDLAAVKEAYDNPPPALGEWVRRDFNPIVRALTRLEKPVIAAMHGVTAGAGLGLALSCDYRIVEPESRLVLAFPGVGVSLDSGTSYFLPRVLGLGRTWEWILSGRTLHGEEAVTFGLAQQLAPPGQSLERAEALAGRMAQGPTAAYGLMKRSLLYGSSQDLDATLDLEAELQDLAGRTDDHLEGVRAFLEKRSAHFTGH